MWTRDSALWALLALLVARVGAQELVIGVVEQPVRALQLAAAVDAALNASGAAVVAPLEPDEPLAPPAAVCAQAAGSEEGGAAVAALGGGDARAARLAAAGAARAALPLLLVEHAPADASWEALELYPHPQVLAQACAELCQAKGWQRAVLLHEGDARGAALLTASTTPLALLARQLPPSHEDALLRNLLLVLKKSGLTKFVVWCSAECSVRVLDAAQRVGLLAEKHSYIMLSLDLHTQPLHDYSHGGANITAFRLFDPESPEVVDVMSQWRKMYTERLRVAQSVQDGEEPAEPEDAAGISAAPPTALLLAHLGTGLVAEAWRRLQLPPAAPADCGAGAGAFHADTLLNYLRSEEWNSEDGAGRLVGGAITWEVEGGRREVQLEVAELTRGGRLERVGLWAPRAGLSWQRHDPPADTPPPESMTNRTFTVLIAENKPYVMMQESMNRLSGNDRYEDQEVNTTVEETPEQGNSNVEVPPKPATIDTEELDAEFLSALGNSAPDTPTYGEKIHETLAQRWLPILRRGIPKEEKETLLKEQKIPENCKLLRAPMLNPEISAALIESTRNRDKKIEAQQQQLGLGITAVSRAMNILVTGGEDKQTKVQAVKIMSDACRILSDLHYVESKSRINLITPALDKSFITLIQDMERDESLFGNKLADKIKASKTIEKQGLQIKKGTGAQKAPVSSTSQPASTTWTSRYQGNWTAPSRYQPSSNRGGRRGGAQRTPLATQRAPKTTAQAKNSYNKQRAAPRQ